MQMYIGDGAKLVRDCFDLAKEKINKEGKTIVVMMIVMMMIVMMRLLF